MPDEPVINQEDLAHLRVKSRTDSRDKDGWAFDDNFVKEFLKDKGREYHQFSSAIELYWRKNISRRELATALGMTLNGVKSLITNIRHRAAHFSNQGVDSKNKLKSSGLNYSVSLSATPIGPKEILRFADGDEDTVGYVNECGRLAVLSVLSLFDVSISPKLIELQNQCDRLRENKAPQEQIDSLIAEAEALQYSVAKNDPSPGHPIFQTFLDHRTNYHGDRRGRPRKVPITTEPALKRKRGRPRKNQTAVSLETADIHMSEDGLEKLPPENFENLCILNEPTPVQISPN